MSPQVDAHVGRAVGLKSSASNYFMSAFADVQIARLNEDRRGRNTAYWNGVIAEVREGGHLVFTRRGLQSHARLGFVAWISRRGAGWLWAAVLTAFLFLFGLQPTFAQKRGGAPPRKQVVSPWDVEAREYLGTPESEAAVNAGLAYLASHQQADGHWSSGGYPSDTGITGLCLMAFLAAGHQPNRGRYGLAISEAVDWLAKCVQRGGQYTPPGFINAGQGSGQPMYGHGFATLALCEVYGMTHRKDLKPKIEAAIHLIEDSQTDDRSMQRAYGGWRYQPAKGDADISVTVVQVLALRGARNAGIKVSQAVIDRAIDYMRRCSNYQSDGGFNYQVGQQLSGPARTGAGVLSLMMAGLRDSPECQGGLRYLETHRLGSGNDWPYREHYYYTLYYITQAMYQAGGEYWKQWYPMIRDRLLRERSANGSWSSGSEAGPEYATAMSVLVLQVPAGLLPIYQK